jgi:hypothetical protein
LHFVVRQLVMGNSYQQSPCGGSLSAVAANERSPITLWKVLIQHTTGQVETNLTKQKKEESNHGKEKQ